MAGLEYPIEMVNGVPVVAASEEIDIGNADWLDAVLREAAARGRGTLVVDMTGTTFCESSGVGVLAQAHKRALAQGGELRLVMPTSTLVLRKFRGHRHRPRDPQLPQPGRSTGTATGHRLLATVAAAATRAGYAPPRIFPADRSRCQAQLGLTRPVRCPARAAAGPAPGPCACAPSRISHDLQVTCTSLHLGQKDSNLIFGSVDRGPIR
jgi:anti-sigma B factor antagonist